jgi:nephrocystin-3
MPHHITPMQSREIRVFLSSTFRDMDVERRHLVKTVFPRIRAACHDRQVGFTEIDLRWGVTEEESRNGATVAICLREIERCRDFPPFFIGFLGERYGWIPREEELTAYWDRHADSPFAGVIRSAVQRGLSVTELEMELAALGDADTQAALTTGDAEDRVLFLLREPTLSAVLLRNAQATGASTADFLDDGGGKLQALKDRIRRSGLTTVDGYASVEEFGAHVERHLRTALDRYFPASEVPSAHEQIEVAHATFRFHRLQNFLPRRDVRTRIVDAILARDRTPSLGPVVLGGPSGQGKSALMADLARHLAEHPATGDLHVDVIDHYVGADGRLSLAEWVTRILHRLHPDIEDLTGPVPQDGRTQTEVLSTWLAYSARRREEALTARGHTGVRVRYVLLLDAIDQLSDGGADLDLLTQVGSDGIVVVSAADDTPGHRAAAHWERIEVTPLDIVLRSRMIRETLTRFRKTLPEAAADQLAAAPQSGSPLFLGLALEELRVDAHHETLAALVSEILESPDPQTLLLRAFLLDPDYSRIEQPDLAVRFMALLGASRRGLTEEHLAALLALPDDPVGEDTGTPRLPRPALSHLLNSFRLFLLNKEDRRAPMHRIFGESALAYVGEASVREFLYQHVAPHSDTLDEHAAEALYQLTALLRQGESRPELHMRLRERMLRWVHLHGTEERLVTDALQLLAADETARLIDGWVAACRSLHKEAVATEGKQLLELGAFLHRVAFAQYQAALAVLEALHERVRSWVDMVEWGENTALALSDVYSEFARHADAERLQRQVHEARRARMGSEHPDTLTAMTSLAVSLDAQGDYAGARALSESVLEARRGLLGAEDPDTLFVMSNLADTLNALGDYDSARTLVECVLEARRRLLGRDHPASLAAMIKLATTHYFQGDFAAAQSLLKRVVDARTRLLGLGHPDTITATSDLAVILGEQGDFAGARALQETTLDTMQRTFGRDHRSTIDAMGNLGLILHGLGDLSASRTMQETVLAAHRVHFGAEHPHTLLSMNNLSATLRELGDHAGALSLLDAVLTTRRREFGEDHPDTLRTLCSVARTLFAQGDWDRAEAMHRSVRDARVRVLGAEHPDTLVSIDDLAQTLRARGA